MNKSFVSLIWVTIYLCKYFNLHIKKFFFYGSVVDLQCCVAFWCTAKWFRYIYTHTHIYIHFHILRKVSLNEEICLVWVRVSVNQVGGLSPSRALEPLFSKGAGGRVCPLPPCLLGAMSKLHTGHSSFTTHLLSPFSPQALGLEQATPLRRV